MTHTAGLLALGLAAGVLSGMFGIGGGLVIVPALIILFSMKELEALGTSLAALVPPVGLLGAIEYYRGGHVHLRHAAIIAAGLFLGAWFGARIITSLSPDTIRRLYAGFLFLVAARMMLTGR
ncbi:MAG: sulfite exporter TauE/SafE family protein [Bryobacteraceae bacterium]